MRQATIDIRIVSAPIHQYAVNTLLTASIISMGSGIFMVESLKIVAKRGTTNISSSVMEATPTHASSAG